MKITYTKLADLEMAYAVAVISLNGQIYYLAASEAEGGGCMLINPQTKKIWPLDGLCGGIMNIVPIPEKPGAFVAIQKFFPVFRSELAEIVHVQMIPQQDGSVQCDVKKICALPYVHRITLAGKPGSRKIVAATLCREKRFIEDWSSVGSVYEITLCDDLDVDAKPNMIFTGVHKNHGLYKYPSETGDRMLISGEEGVFQFSLHDKSIWSVQKTMLGETSDVWLCDIDGDGQQEMISIQPFHGDKLRIFRRQKDNWEPIWEDKMEFGHAIWAGEILGNIYVIGASRAGAKELVVYRVENKQNGLALESVVAFEGLGVAQIAACQDGGTFRALVSSHGQNQVGEILFS